MNRLEIRTALVQELESFWASYKSACPLFYPSQGDTIDLLNVGDWFIKVQIEFLNAEQITLGESPLHRTWGRMQLLLVSKMSASDAQRQTYLDLLTENFKFRALGGLTTKVPTPGRYEEHDGWCSEAILVPFFADSNT